MRFKNLIIIGFIGLTMISCLPDNRQTRESASELKVLSWNVWHAGHSKAFPKEGCKGIKDILKESEADVILMIETYGCSDEIADYLGYYHRLLSDNLSIYSRYPIVKTYLFPDSISTFKFGGIELNIDGKRVRVFDVWLHYLPDTRLVPTNKSEREILAWDNAGTRDEEISSILSVLSPFLEETDSIPIIVGGDFNSHSHLDWTKATKDLYNHGGATVNWTVSTLMENAGFKDSFREKHPDVVKELGPTWYWTDDNQKNRMDRIDYIYYIGKTISVENSESYNADLPGYLTFKGKKFFYASDHGFVFTTFTLEK